MTRPDIKNIKASAELKRWYWLKKELVDFCKQSQLSYVGTKFEILERIADALDKGYKRPSSTIKPKPTSAFNWAKASLTLDTVITDSYTNGVNTRRFFKQHCGERFHFSIPFMAFMKNNCGKTLQDAVNEWKRLAEQGRSRNFKSTIPEGNQYNQYIRDFFHDNPGMTMEQARRCWKLKRSLPLGRHVYERSDLNLK